MGQEFFPFVENLKIFPLNCDFIPLFYDFLALKQKQQILSLDWN